MLPAERPKRTQQNFRLTPHVCVNREVEPTDPRKVDTLDIAPLLQRFGPYGVADELIPDSGSHPLTTIRPLIGDRHRPQQVDPDRPEDQSNRLGGCWAMAGRRQFGGVDRLPSVPEWRDPRLGRQTLEQWAEDFIATKVDLRPKTRAGYRSLLDTRIIPALGAMQIARIRPLDIRKWLATMAAEGLSASRRRQALGLLGQIMTAAVANGVIVASPCAGVPGPPLPQPQPDYLTTEEVDRLLAAASRPWDLLVMILVFGGLRWGEAAALRRARCDLRRSRLLVTQSLSEVNGVLHFGPTKTRQRRTVSLPQFVGDRLAQHVETGVGTEDEALVFTSRRGSPIRYSNFRIRVWLPVTRTAGLEGIRTHIC